MTCVEHCPQVNLVDVSDIFIFFCLGKGKGECVAPGRRGGRFSIEIPTRGGGGEGPGGCLWGGGAKYFFSVPKCPPSKV